MVSTTRFVGARTQRLLASQFATAQPMTRFTHSLRFSLALCVLAAVLAVGTPTSAQPLSPDASETCEPTEVTSLLNPGTDEKAACEERTYTLPATGAFSLRQDYYEEVRVVGWNQESVEVKMTVVARRNSTMEDARADAQQVQLTDDDGTLKPTGPAKDAPGWWSVSYEIRVPMQTALNITSDNGGIAAHNIAGAHLLQSKNGDVSYTLPKNASAELKVSTEYGDIDFGFPIMVQGAINKNVETTIGDGGPTVRLISKNGDITVDRIE